jgi:chromosomal replication initiation ATPase DnaA
MDHVEIVCRRDAGRLAKSGGRRKVSRTASETRLFLVLESAFATGRADLCAATRGRSDIAFARQVGMYLARVVLGMTLSEAGFVFARDRTTASHACRLVEDLRDDRRIDALLEAMEALMLCEDVQPRGARR